ncbi:cytosolic phospholipase A2 zeta-like [Boleophthalmus pectinirostris]|uniref:cytosolic phospholipase A2 zeta-like n=1 Tax=Boleophthalmus pectinirostris TaxID=150288 RepID=UPI00242F2331|nr:cytosolic phospholipase A2 zeta-like [Boleophthalmus pectinirostris]
MEQPGAGAQRSVRRGPSLSAGEHEYIQQRKEVSAQALHDLGLNCTTDEVPHVALLASGGGQRAAVGLIGSLTQMSRDGLLDPVLYLSGVSGSTWSMASLYEDPQWSRSLDSYRSSLLTPHSVDSEKILSWLQDKAETPEFSLSDTWGALTSAAIMKTWDNRTLSEEAARNASNPYPVYGAVEQFCFNEGPTQGKWFELTPHEAGFSELELFVETSALGSKFQGGALLEDTPEMDMIQVQGILGSALANEKMEDHIPDWLNFPEYLDTAAHQYLRRYNIIMTFIRRFKSHVNNEEVLQHVDNLQSALQDKVNRDESEQLRSLQQRGPQFLKWTYELGTTVQTWAYGLPEGPVKAQGSSLVDKIIPLVLRWEWGTVKNFLYKYDEVPVPSCLASAELLHLMDGGLLVNTAYPSFLGPRRDIDLIIAPEYSAGEMFETLTLARAYAAEVGKPFPQLDDTVLEEEKLWPKDCYVFEGNDTAPTIVFMPLFNRRNCKDADEWAQRMEEFSTFQRSYSPEMIDRLLKIAQENMKNNKETVLREITKALERRRNKTHSAQVQPDQPDQPDQPSHQV